MKGEIKKHLLKMLSKDMSEMMGEGRELPSKKGMAVKVVAKDEEGLKKGLSKAEELLKLKNAEMGEESEEESDDMIPSKLMAKMSDEESEEESEMPEMEDSEEESEESEEELKAKIAELQAKLAKKA